MAKAPAGRRRDIPVVTAVVVDQSALAPVASAALIAVDYSAPAAVGRGWNPWAQWLARALLPVTVSLLPWAAVFGTGHTLSFSAPSGTDPVEYSAAIRGGRFVAQSKRGFCVRIPAASTVDLEANGNRVVFRRPVEI